MLKFAFLFFVSINAYGESIGESMFRKVGLYEPTMNWEWRTEDTARIIMLGLEHAVDANQTRHFYKLDQTICPEVDKQAHYDSTTGTYVFTDRCTTYQAYESQSRWALGKRPSNASINQYFIGLTVAEIFFSCVLPQGWRDGFQYIRIIDSGDTIYNNKKIGLGFSIGI